MSDSEFERPDPPDLSAAARAHRDVEELFDVRSVTLSVNLAGCFDRPLHKFCESMYQALVAAGSELADVCQQVSAELGVPIIQRRLAVTPVQLLAADYQADDLVHVARTWDGAAANARIDAVTGFVAFVERGLSDSSRQILRAIPTALAQTERVYGGVVAGRGGDICGPETLSWLGHQVREISHATSQSLGIGATRFSIWGNPTVDGVTGGWHGPGQPGRLVHVGISAPRVIRRAIERRRQRSPLLTVRELFAEVQAAVFRATRVAELVAVETARRIGAEVGQIDLTPAATLRPGDSLASLLPFLGVQQPGAPGTAQVLANLIQAIEVGGKFASSRVSAPTTIPLSFYDDAFLAETSRLGDLTINQLSMLAGAGASGLDGTPVPGDTDPSALGAIIGDQLALAKMTGRPVSIRLVPVPGHKAGEYLSYPLHHGRMIVLPIRNEDSAAAWMTLR
jgi:uncharacterized protein